MTQRDSTPLSAPTRFPSHKLGRFVTTGEGFLEHSTGDRIDLHSFLTGQSPDVRLMPIHTNIMRASGLNHGSIAVFDRSRKPKLRDLMVVRFNGDVIMRRLERRTGRYCFVADDPREEILYVTPEAQVERLGVIIHAINTIHAAS